MDYQTAIFLGNLLGRVLDPLALVLSLGLGAVASGWRSFFVGGAVILAIIMAIRVPAIARTTRLLGKPEPSYLETGLWYVGSITLIAGAVYLARKFMARKKAP